MEYAVLRLSDRNDHTKYFDLKYKLIKNDFVNKWVECVLEAQQKQCAISEPWAIYNLNDTLNSSFVKDKLNELIKKVNSESKIFDREIEEIDDQDTLNYIHSIFEKHHGKLDEWKSKSLFHGKSENFRKNLSEINQIVHACEETNGAQKIRVVYFDLPKYKKFTESDYKLFTNKRCFGSLYHLYCDVGKNIESLTVDEDDHHHDIVPNIHFSADCIAYFKEDTDLEVMDLEKRYQTYVKENEKTLQEKGYANKDIRLTTGRIELGRLETKLSNNELLTRIKEFDNIQSLSLI